MTTKPAKRTNRVKVSSDALSAFKRRGFAKLSDADRSAYLALLAYFERCKFHHGRTARVINRAHCGNAIDDLDRSDQPRIIASFSSQWLVDAASSICRNKVETGREF